MGVFCNVIFALIARTLSGNHLKCSQLLLAAETGTLAQIQSFGHLPFYLTELLYLVLDIMSNLTIYFNLSCAKLSYMK